MKNIKLSNSKKGYATLEMILITPVFVLLLGVIAMFGTLFSAKLQMQYDGFSAAKYASFIVKTNDLSVKVTTNNCQSNAEYFLKSRGYDIKCIVDNNIMSLAIAKEHSFTNIPFIENYSQTIQTSIYMFVY